MGIYIKGMPRPCTCAECPCLRHDSMDGEHSYQCNITLGIRKNIDRKPKWCPLVEVKPPHGKLIDAEMYKNKAAYEAQAMPDDCSFVEYTEWLMDKTPAAIEAEYIERKEQSDGSR